ncbi:cation-efflux pump [bacterium DOLZORAL124_64_63]|nr:MAG: cation-efflux pump [bacterium DOLZORAL124_64_63]
MLRPMVCTWIGLVSNAGLAVGKIIVGLLAGSTALVADGNHSLADVLSDVGILLSLKAASRPPDENHPYGHHSFETLGAIVVAVFMLATAGVILAKAAVAIAWGRLPEPELPALIASLVSVVIKEIMARYTLWVGQRHHSPALLANGAMHRSDAISSLVAALGIGGAMAGWLLLDSVGAIVIAVLIGRMGWGLLRENVMVLMDTMPEPELLESIRSAGAGVACVQEIRDLRVRRRGRFYLADLRIAVHPDHAIGAAHDIAHDVEDRIRTAVPNMARVFVHVEPGGRDGHGPCAGPG